MSRYSQYGSNNNYYDPVGSQPAQPTGYSYQAAGSTTTYQTAPSASSYGQSAYSRDGTGSYSNQQYDSSGRYTNNSASHAAAALSSLSGTQTYGQTSSASTANSSSQYNSTPSNSNGGISNRNETRYPSAQSSSTFGRLSIPEQSQTSSNTFGATQATYSNSPSNARMGSNSRQTTYTQQQSQGQPPRYNSPLQAVQAQHGHRQQTSQSSNHLPSPQTSSAPQQNWQSRASAEPSSITVDPSQVYDNRAELQRKAQIDAEKRQKYDAEQAAKKAEEERLAEGARKREEEERNKRADADAARKAGEQKRKNEQRRKAREDKKQSKNAATALQRLSSGAANAPGSAAAEDEEAEMRAMFQKMREFNAKNPAMLAKLWEEERTTHEAAKSTPTPTTRPASSSPKPASKTAKQIIPPSASSNKQAAASPQTQPVQPTRTTPVAATTTSLWPPHKKGLLSEVTSKWLMALPSNSGKFILPQDVHKILDSSPSYVQLCESLESMGLRFDRSTLARELLKAVPDGLKPQTVTTAPIQPTTLIASANGVRSASSDAQRRGKQSAANVRTPSLSTAIKTVEYEAPIALADVAREVNVMHKTSFQPASTFNGPQNPRQSPYFTPAFSPGSRALPSSTSAPPFSTASRASSSTASPEIKPLIKPEEPRRPPADKEEAARKRTFGDLVDLTAQDDSDEEAPPSKKMMTNPPEAQPAESQYRDPLQYLAKPTSFKQFMMPHMNGTGQNVVSMASQQRQALGYQQSPRLLPSHPVPSAPAVPFATKQKGPTPGQLQLSRMRGKLLVEPIMRDRAARKTTYDSRTIARDILLATGRHPDMRGLNLHLAPMQKLLGQHGLDSESGNRSDLATIRWDVIDPEPAKQPAKENKDQHSDIVPTTSDHQQRSPQLLPPNKKKVGRPRKSEYLVPLTNPELGTPASANASASNRASPSTSNPATTSSLHTPEMSSGTAIGYGAFHQLGPDGKKKKGRPFGWRKNVHSREAQGLPTATNPSRKAAARPRVDPEPVGPEYQVFPCGWEDCKSELHNAEVLKKHMVKVHGRVDGEGERWECRWEGCSGNAAGMRWMTLEGWLKHIDAVHLAPIRWKLGDGPREADPSTFHTTAELPSYLADSRGRLVTPIILPPSPPTATERPTNLQTILSQRGRTQSAFDAELRELEDDQRIVGPTLGRMGCVFANEARREGFLDDEDFEDEVVGGEHDVQDEAYR